MGKYDEIIDLTNNLLAQYTIQVTLRQIYYRLVGFHVIDNTPNAYKRLSKILVRAREEGTVDGDKFVDHRRFTHGGDIGFDDIDDFMRKTKRDFLNAWKTYQRNAWQGQPNYIEIWVEKDALASQLLEVADPYGVCVNVSSGYSSYTFVQDAVVRITDALNDGRRPGLLCFTDSDPSGDDMILDLGRRLEKYGIEDAPDMIRKVALTDEQVKLYDLPPAPVKLTDTRAKKWVEEHGHGVVELDALDPPVLQELCRRAIVGTIVPEIWNPLQDLSGREKTLVMERFARVSKVIEEM
jgi:hypothetical protein